VNRHSLRSGATASGPSSGFYVAVVAASGGWEHLRDQARADGRLLMPIIVAFGTQVALSVELRRRHRARTAPLPGTFGPATGSAQEAGSRWLAPTVQAPLVPSTSDFGPYRRGP
jgi:hypothetical protein